MKKLLLFFLCISALGESLCGQETRNDGFGELVLIPAGHVTMGDGSGEGEEDERPVHTVFIDSFYMGLYEVLNEEYRQFIQSDGYVTKAYWKSGGFMRFAQPENWRSEEHHGGYFPGNEKYPVVGVSWYEAMAYCAWLSDKTGRTYRLPTEAEWERAARNNDQRKYPWGNDIDGTCANFRGSKFPGTDGLMPVGFFFGSQEKNFETRNNQSPFGVFDMSGNVWEWCLDWYAADYYAKSDTLNPQGPFFGGYRVVRGGGWNSPVEELTCSNRHFQYPHFRYFDVGFRIACELEHSTAGRAAF